MSWCTAPVDGGPADGYAVDLGLEPVRADGGQLGEPDQQVASPGRAGRAEGVRAAHAVGAGDGGEGAQGGGGEGVAVAELDGHVGAGPGLIAEGDPDRPEPDPPAHV